MQGLSTHGFMRSSLLSWVLDQHPNSPVPLWPRTPARFMGRVVMEHILAELPSRMRLQSPEAWASLGLTGPVPYSPTFKSVFSFSLPCSPLLSLALPPFPSLSFHVKTQVPSLDSGDVTPACASHACYIILRAFLSRTFLHAFVTLAQECLYLLPGNSASSFRTLCKSSLSEQPP